jgi:glycosyltransferase involved in cell wall biosynthesis
VPPAPAASIVVPAYESSATIGASLECLRRQAFTDFEIIVVDSSPDDRTSAIVRGGFPEVRYIHRTRRLLPHEARNDGARAARGQVLVFTDPDCLADPAWLGHHMAHHRNGTPMVGGALDGPRGWWNRSVHATKFPWWLPQSPAGPRREVPTGNASVARAIWESLGGFRGEYFAGDSEFCWRVRAAGHPVWFDPRARVTHLQDVEPGAFVRERWRRGIDFGEMRSRLGRWSRTQSLARLVASPLAPLVMTWRSARHAMAGGYLRAWLPTLPVQALGNLLWCGGEASVLVRRIVADR